MKKKILIAEDDYASYKLIFEIIKNENIEILWAKNGSEAIEIYKENPDISTILMDIQMPVKNGDMAAKEIKEINNDIPIIGISAFQYNVQNNLYFDSYIQKPVHINELLSAIENHIKNVITDIIEKNEKDQNKLKESEEKSIKALTGVTEILQLTDYGNKTQSNEIIKKLDEIKKILENK